MYCIKSSLPTPTLVIRKEGEAWQHPFVVVYEPYTGAQEDHSIQSVEKLEKNGIYHGLKVVSKIQDKTITQWIINPPEDGVYEDRSLNLRFEGRLAILTLDESKKLQNVYVGEGQKLVLDTITVEVDDPVKKSAYVDFTGKTSAAKKVSGLIYYDQAALAEVKKRIAAGDPYYTQALDEVLATADKYLEMDANPVVNKSLMPPSGDKHDYLSIAPYWWPNPETEDGLPWIRRDGEVNPMTRGDDTDRNRLANMMDAVTYLTFAYYYTHKAQYARKAVDLMEIWFVDTDTKVNPHVNYGQGIPGRTDGRPFGIIEWTDIDNVVTALQLLSERGAIDGHTRSKIDHWLSSYVDWLLNSELGRMEGTRSNNHANWYDYQVVGLLAYLGRTKEARAHAEKAKLSRIAHQIEPNGAQPHELSRTKSLSYSTMNLRAMTLVGAVAQHLGVDLLHFKTEDGRSLRKAAEYLVSFAMGEKEWPHEQITEGGWQQVAESRVKPLLSIMSCVYQERLAPESTNLEESLSPLQRLQYPPLIYNQQGKTNH